MGKKKKHGFYSKAQWKWAFATHKPWARRWAHQRAWSTLPRRKGVRKR